MCYQILLFFVFNVDVPGDDWHVLLKLILENYLRQIPRTEHSTQIVIRQRQKQLQISCYNAQSLALLICRLYYQPYFVQVCGKTSFEHRRPNSISQNICSSTGLCAITESVDQHSIQPLYLKALLKLLNLHFSELFVLVLLTVCHDTEAKPSHLFTTLTSFTQLLSYHLAFGV